MVPVFKNVSEKSIAKSYHPIIKVFEEPLNNRLADHPEKCSLFSNFPYGFRSSQSTADFLTVVSDRIAMVLNRSGVTRAVALDISTAFDAV